MSAIGKPALGNLCCCLKNTEFILRGYLIVFIHMKSLPIPCGHGDNVGRDAMILNAPIVGARATK